MRRALLFTMTAVLFFMVAASTEASEGVNAMKEISVRDFANLAVGNAENKTAGTGCTVLLFKGGAPAGLSVMGGRPGLQGERTAETHGSSGGHTRHSAIRRQGI